MKQIKSTLEQRNKILQLLMLNKYVEANACANFLGFTEGVTAEFFEYVIKKDGLHMEVIQALSVYYANETKVVRNNAGVQ